MPTIGEFTVPGWPAPFVAAASAAAMPAGGSTGAGEWRRHAH